MLLPGRCPVLLPRRGWYWNPPPGTRNPAGQTVGSAERATSSVTTGRLISLRLCRSVVGVRVPSSRDSVSAPVSRTRCTDVSCKDSQLENSSGVEPVFQRRRPRATKHRQPTHGDPAKDRAHSSFILGYSCFSWLWTSVPLSGTVISRILQGSF